MYERDLFMYASAFLSALHRVAAFMLLHMNSVDSYSKSSVPGLSVGLSIFVSLFLSCLDSLILFAKS